MSWCRCFPLPKLHFFLLCGVEVIANKTLTITHHLMTAGKAEMIFPRTASLPCVIPSGLCWWSLEEKCRVKITVLTQNHHSNIYRGTWIQFQWSISHGSSFKMSLEEISEPAKSVSKPAPSMQTGKTVGRAGSRKRFDRDICADQTFFFFFNIIWHL